MPIPTKEDLVRYGKDYKSAATFYRVSERTIRRWMVNMEIYKPKDGYKPGKLNQSIARQIRVLYDTDKYTQTALAEKFKVTQAIIGRIINNLIYKTELKLGGTAEVKFNVEK